MEEPDLTRFYQYRSNLLTAIAESCQRAGEGYAKMMEGVVRLGFPGCTWDEWWIDVYCYQLGPARKYYYSGGTLDTCLEKAERDLKKWIEEDIQSQEAREDRRQEAPSE